MTKPRKPFDGIEKVKMQIGSANRKYLRLAREQVTFDLMAVVDRIFKEQHDKYLAVLEDQRFARMFSHKTRWSFTGVEKCGYGTLVIPFFDLRYDKALGGPALCTYQQYRDRRGHTGWTPDVRDKSYYYRALALKVCYPKDERRYHVEHQPPNPDNEYAKSFSAFYVTPRNLNDHKLFEALADRLRPLYDLSMQLTWQRQFADYVLGKLCTPGQVMRVWPEAPNLMHPHHAQDCQQARPSHYPQALLRDMRRVSTGGPPITDTYIKKVLQEVMDSVLSAELISFEGADDPPDDQAHVANFAPVWVKKKVIEINN